MVTTDYTDYPKSYRYYGGNKNQKLGILIEGDPWIIKISDARNAVREYVGSQIYQLSDIPTQETRLGWYKNNLVVACKDVCSDGDQIISFEALKNDYNNAYSKDTDINGRYKLNMVKEMFETNPILCDHWEMRSRFWDMFVLDAMIKNGERTNTDWGLIQHPDHTMELCPVYDNDGAFQSEYSFFTDDYGRPIDPERYIMSMKDQDCNNAIERLDPCEAWMENITQMIETLPEDMAENKFKQQMMSSMYSTYDKIVKPVYDRLVDKVSRHIILEKMRAENEDFSL